MKYVKLTVVDDCWFRLGTEVWHYDHPRRINLEEFETQWRPHGMILVTGIRDSDGSIDGESSPLDEFNIKIVDSDNSEEFRKLEDELLPK